jgi:hypothetical protein
VRDETVDLLERSGIEEQFDSLTRGELAGLVLTPATRLAAALVGAAVEVGQARDRIHQTLYDPKEHV